MSTEEAGASVSNVITFRRETRAQIGERIVLQFEAYLIAALAANNFMRARQLQSDIKALRLHYGLSGEEIELC